MKFKLFLSALLVTATAHAAESNSSLEQEAQKYKPQYKTNYSTDMLAFMRNQPIYDGIQFIYVNPNGVSPAITQSVISATTTVTVPVTTTWTTTSIIKEQVVTPYTITSSSESWNRFGGGLIEQAQTWSPDALANSILNNVGNGNYQPGMPATTGGVTESSYWVQHGTPQTRADVYAAFNACYSSGNCAAEGFFGNVAVDTGSAWNVNAGAIATNTTTSYPANYYDNGVLVRARRVETTYYSAAEDRYRSRVYDVVDTNENGIIDEGDTVYTVQVGQDGKVERTTVTETGERVETREHEQTETHSETHSEEHSTTTEQTVQNKKNVWKFSFSPILSIDIQAPTKVTSLDSQFSAPLAAPMKPAQKIEWASLNSPYLVEKKSSITAAIGGAVVASYSAWTPGTALTVGLAPIVGTEKIYKTVVPNSKALETVVSPSAPTVLSDIKKMKVGDTFSYAQMGGVMFAAGGAYVVVNAGVNLVAIGQWRTEIQKVGETRYYVNRSAVKINNFGASIGSTLTLAYSVGAFNAADSQFSWLFDISDAKAAKAMENFVFNGVAFEAQKLANAKGETTVLAVAKQDSISRGALRSVSMGVPYLTASWSKGKINTTQITQFFPDNTLGEAKYAVYMKARDSRMVNWFENSTVAFTGAQYDVKDAKTKALSDSGYYGQFAFVYSDTHTDDFELQEAIDQLIAITGLRGQLAVEVPKSGNIQKPFNFGYTNVQFSLTYDKAATDYLMALASDVNASKKLEADAVKFLNAYLKKNYFNLQTGAYYDPNKMCGIMFPFEANACVNFARATTAQATAAVLANLRTMKAAIAKNDKTGFASAYAAAGQALTSSPYTFQAVLAAAVAGTAGKGVMSSYMVSGTRIKSYWIAPTWDADLVTQVFPEKK